MTTYSRLEHAIALLSRKTWATRRRQSLTELGYMWDDPEIVPHEKCRYDVGLEVPAVIPGGEVGRI